MTNASPETLPTLMVSIDSVCRMTALDDQMVDRLVRSKRFPAPVKLGHRTRRWAVAQIEEWVRQQTEPAVA